MLNKRNKILLIFFVVLILFSNNFINIFNYYSTIFKLEYLGINHKEFISINTYLKTQRYINKIYLPKENTCDFNNKIKCIINNAKSGEALGFLTENIQSQEELIKLFPNELFNVNRLIQD